MIWLLAYVGIEFLSVGIVGMVILILTGDV